YADDEHHCQRQPANRQRIDHARRRQPQGQWLPHDEQHAEHEQPTTEGYPFHRRSTTKREAHETLPIYLVLLVHLFLVHHGETSGARDIFRTCPGCARCWSWGMKTTARRTASSLSSRRTKE